ncbi:uncharacterized protein LOC116612434 [Nematostella vectensis]|uniref:uncharacterized protein LOC116612434 n=1 Tax=Nematostella vectensis TaxID=45351 RepID=UPI0020771847|nr:uncharacterized protein LOC116612434 [Nematostella vectensis]
MSDRLMFSLGSRLLLYCAVFFAFAVDFTDGERCESNQYTIDHGDGTSVCQNCQECPHGQGLEPSCGKKLYHPPKIECVSCTSGKTYSDTYGVSSCKPCHICTTRVKKNCTVESDTQCTDDCKHKPRTYYENSTHDCQPCSYCCKPESAVLQAECAAQGLPKQRQCSIHDTCPTPTPRFSGQTSLPAKSTTEYQTATEGPGGISKWSITWIVIAVIVAILLGIFIFYWIRRKKKKRERGRQQGQAGQNGGPEEGYPLRSQGQQECGIKIVHSPEQTLKTMQEGKSHSFVCNIMEPYPNCCSPRYQWYKDGIEIQGERRENLTLKHLTVPQFGVYYCSVSCSHHTNQEKTEDKELDVTPSPNKEYKKIYDLSQESESILVQLLSTKHSHSIGNWKKVGTEYGMERVTLNSFDGKDGAAQDVIDYIKSAKPDLTVYTFCKYLKTINRRDAVLKLEGELTVDKHLGEIPSGKREPKNTEKSNRAESGIELSSESLPLTVDLQSPSSPKNSPVHDRNVYVATPPRDPSPPLVKFKFSNPGLHESPYQSEDELDGKPPTRQSHQVSGNPLDRSFDSLEDRDEPKSLPGPENLERKRAYSRQQSSDSAKSNQSNTSEGGQPPRRKSSQTSLKNYFAKGKDALSRQLSNDPSPEERLQLTDDQTEDSPFLPRRDVDA